MSIPARIAVALQRATDTREVLVGAGVLPQAPALFERFSERPALIVADPNTFAAAGRETLGHFSRARVPCAPPFLLPSRTPHADEATLALVRQAIAAADATAVAVGAGTINDLCKRASFELDRPYMAVATAASVDGYAAFGASLSMGGFKKTVPCSAPHAIVADTDVLRQAPYPMTAAGYADLAAKITGGSDWLIADAVGADPVLEPIWDMTQTPLRGWLAHPELLAAGDPERIGALFEGLMLTGFAMQATQSSRPASGAEHLCAHVWEMTGLRGPDGTEPSHGFKVAIGTVLVTRLTERLLDRDFTAADAVAAADAYPTWEQRERFIHELFGEGPLRARIVEESRAKHLTPTALGARLHVLATGWERLRRRVRAQLVPAGRLGAMLRAAGCPVTPAAIGLTPARAAATLFAAQMIRTRYTVLDLAAETGRLPELAAEIRDGWETFEEAAGR